MMSMRTRCWIASLLLFPGSAFAAGMTLSVDGSVSTAAGEVPADTLVELVPVLSQLESSRRLLAGQQAPAAVATSAAGPDSGRFRLRPPAPGLFRVRLSAPGYMLMRSLPMPVTGALELPHLTLVATTTLDVVVHNAEDRPVVGAWIVGAADADSRALWRDLDSPGWWIAPRIARIDADGYAAVPRLSEERLDLEIHIPGDSTPRSFAGIGTRLDVRLEPVPVPHRQLTLTGAEAGVVVAVAGITPGRHTAIVRHPHFDRLRQEIEIEPGRNARDFVFTSAHRLAGRVVDEHGAPLADTAVELTAWRRRGVRQARTLTDGRGRFDVPRLAGGDYRLTVEKSGWVTAEPALRVELRGGDVDDLEIVLRPSGRFTGQILGLDFAELAGVRVEALADDGRRRQGDVDHEGRYQVAELAPGDWLLAAEASEGTRRVETRVTLAPREAEAYRDLEFEPGLTLSGRIEHGGEPVAAAQIALLGADVVAGHNVLTDHQGRFRFEALEPGSYRLSVSSRRDLLIHNEDVVLESDRDLLVELASAGFTGRVVAADGAGVHRALVILRQMLDAAGDRAESSMFTVGTDAEGAFRFDRLPTGRFRVRIRKDACPASRWRSSCPTPVNCGCGYLTSSTPRVAAPSPSREPTAVPSSAWIRQADHNAPGRSTAEP